jgi:putative oxidoreductase
MFGFLSTPDLASVVLRLALAAVFITHGSMKIEHEMGTNWYRFEGETPTAAVQATVAWGELVCGLALAVGLLTRVAALGVIAVMLGALYMVTWRLDFIAVTHSIDTQGSTVGYEYNYTLMAMAVALVILGAGKLSLDRLLFRRRQPASTPAYSPSAEPATARM